MAQQPMWTAPSVSAPVHACVTVPGSKSLTNRTLILAALAAAQGQGTSTISGALRSRDTDLMIGAVRTLGLTVDGDADELTVSGDTVARRRRAGGLRAGRHRAAVRATGGRPEPVGGRVRRRRAGPGASHRTVAGRAAHPRRRRRRRRHAVLGDRHRFGARWASRDRRVVVVAVRVRPDAVGARVHRRADDRAHRHVGALGPAHRDDGGDAAAGRRRGGRRCSEPLAGVPRDRGGAALGGGARPVQRRAVPGRGGGQRRGGAHRGLADAQPAARRHHSGHPGAGECDCDPDGFVSGSQGCGGVRRVRRGPARCRRACPRGRGAGRAGRTRCGVTVARHRTPARP